MLCSVVKLILQFCKENSLLKTMKTLEVGTPSISRPPAKPQGRKYYCALQEESGTAMNTVESVESFTSDITNGRWDAVLAQVT